jgi:biopolymer transport protein ExbD
MSSIRTNTAKLQRPLQTIFAFALVVQLSLGISHAQQLQRGISVQMAHTTNATAYPAADYADAWIVAVAADGRLYFGVTPVTPEQLLEKMEATPRLRDTRLYIKADAHSTFSSLRTALGPARSAQFENAVLLTSQPESPSQAGLVPPQGINVEIVPQKSGAIDVRISMQAGVSQLMVNGKTIAWSDLEGTLKNLGRGQDQVVQAEANDAVPFADLIRVLDEARKTGAKLAVPSYHSL